MAQDEYWQRFLAAQDAGLNREAVIAVANNEMTLDEALGDMDMDAESLPFDPAHDLDNETESNEDFIPW